MRSLALLSLLFLVGCPQPPVVTNPAPDPVAAFTYHYVESDPRRPFSPTFLGIQTWQNPADMWVMQEIISEVRPDLIIEAGTARGGSALYFASVLEQLGEGRVLTIDIERQASAAEKQPLWQRRVEQLIGDSVSSEIIEQVKARAQGKRVLVTLDSLHTADHVAKELSLYADLVSPGSYLVVQDTVIDKHPEWIKRYAGYNGSTAGPAPAVEAFLRERKDFSVDRSREEKFLFTFHPGGYLKKASN